MLESYFRYRTNLAKMHKRFECPETCNAPGCRSSAVIVEVTIFDLIGMGQMLDTPVSNLFSNNCTLGVQDIKFNPRYKRLLVKLIKPCHFHQMTHCTVHDSKPLYCVLFPEYHKIKGLVSTFASQSIFSKFPCLNGDITISKKRRDVLKKLRHISRIEEAVSCYFLFGEPSFIIDSKPLNRQLKSDYPKEKDISPQAYDQFLVKKLNRIGFYHLAMDNVLELDTHLGIEGILKTLGQDALVTSLIAHVKNPGTIHTFKKDRVKQLRRKLGPQALTYMIF